MPEPLRYHNGPGNRTPREVSTHGVRILRRQVLSNSRWSSGRARWVHLTRRREHRFHAAGMEVGLLAVHGQVEPRRFVRSAVARSGMTRPISFNSTKLAPPL